MTRPVSKRGKFLPPPGKKYVGQSLKVLECLIKHWPHSENYSPPLSQAGYGSIHCQDSKE